MKRQLNSGTRSFRMDSSGSRVCLEKRQVCLSRDRVDVPETCLTKESQHLPSVRSRPPGVITSISRSARNGSVTVPSPIASGILRSMTIKLARSVMEARHARRISTVRLSSQSWIICFKR